MLLRSFTVIMCVKNTVSSNECLTILNWYRHPKDSHIRLKVLNIYEQTIDKRKRPTFEILCQYRWCGLSPKTETSTTTRDSLSLINRSKESRVTNYLFLLIFNTIHSFSIFYRACYISRILCNIVYSHRLINYLCTSVHQFISINREYETKMNLSKKGTRI